MTTGFGSTFKNDLSLLIFNATNISLIADNTATTPITSVFAALHTATAVSGNQTTSEATYTSYARVGATRNSGGYTVASGVTTNTAAITFPACTGGSNTITDVSLGTLTSGTGKVIVGGALTASLSVSSGITPQFAISALSVTLT